MVPCNKQGAHKIATSSGSQLIFDITDNVREHIIIHVHASEFANW